ncbi:MAG: hypothetical protein GY751_26770 [Bacteroidetes bacterium]|nr:hypothetical protein [Bacteroidota bacterium]
MFEELLDTWKDRIWKDDRLLDLQQIARENNWRFHTEARFPEQPTGLKQFKLFKGKKSKRVRGVVSTKEKDRPFSTRIYDYIYYGETRKRKTTVLEFYHQGIDLHNFKIHPKSKMKQFKEIFVRQDEEFYLQDTFFSKYELVYDRNRSIKLNLNDDILKLICSRKGIRIEGNDHYLLVYYRNKIISAADLKKEYSFAKELFTEIIEHSTLLEL